MHESGRRARLGLKFGPRAHLDRAERRDGGPGQQDRGQLSVALLDRFEDALLILHAGQEAPGLSETRVTQDQGAQRQRVEDSFERLVAGDLGHPLLQGDVAPEVTVHIAGGGVCPHLG